MLARIAVLLAPLLLLASCNSLPPIMANFDTGTERVTKTGQSMVAWGHKFKRYKNDGSGGYDEYFQPRYEVIYAGIQGGSIVLERRGYRNIQSSDGWTVETVWIQERSSTTYHPKSSKLLSIGDASGTATLEVIKADGVSIHFRVKELSATSSTTISGPTERKLSD